MEKQIPVGDQAVFTFYQILTKLPRLALLILRGMLQACLLVYLLIAVPVRAAWWWLRLLSAPPPAAASPEHFEVICFSHVPWSHIWQRNHHTMIRLAQNRKVIYMQTTSIAYIHWFVRDWPNSLREYQNTSPRVKLLYPLLYPGQSRLRAVAVINRWLLSTQVRWLTHTHRLQNPVFWFYYPACSYLLDTLEPTAVVYDIQDEYSAFDWSPCDINEREQQLIARADIIFAGTQALYQAKTPGFRGKAFFYPCAVEFSHFFSAAPRFDAQLFEAHPEIDEATRARILRVCHAFNLQGTGYGTLSVPPDDSTPGTSPTGRARVSAQYHLRGQRRQTSTLVEPREIRDLRRPRLLYVGLIDRRIDPDLLAHLGQSHPDWEIVMLGPVDHRVFDQQSVEAAASNVRFIGPALYRWLPNFMAHCDVFLMPWKVNELTLHINPTKTLEYMAAAKPVVSISLPDLENLFADSVNLATTPVEFVAQCEAALKGERWSKVATGLERAQGFAWETVVKEMEAHVSETIKAKHLPRPATTSQAHIP